MHQSAPAAAADAVTTLQVATPAGRVGERAVDDVVAVVETMVDQGRTGGD